jgi:uncharacterized RDD family membrane protein YckC
MDVIVPNSELPAYLRRKEGKRFDIRAGAYLIDWVIHIGVSYAIAYLVLVLFSIIYTANTGDEPVQSFQNNQWLYLIFSQVVYFLSIGWLGATPGWLFLIISEMLYFSVFEWLYGATPGKLILKMRVVREDGSRCSLGQAVVRGVLRLWDGFFFGWVATQRMEEPLQQRYGDRLAHTLVVGSQDPVIKRPRAGRWFVAAVLAYLAVESLASYLWTMYMTP